MTLLDFSNTLTPAQLVAIKQLTGQTVERVMDIKTQFDNETPFMEQARALVESIGLSAEGWQRTPLLVNLPSLNLIAALLLKGWT